MRKLLTSALLIATAVISDISAENVYLYKSGKVIFCENTENIGRVAYEDNNSSVAIYDTQGSKVFKASLSEIDYMSNKHEAPVADMLDVLFRQDGSAYDASPMGMKVVASNKKAVTTYYSNEFDRYVVSLPNSWGSTVTSSYRVDYATNTAFRNALADGHTLEAVVMANFDGLLSSDSNNKEAKCFASHQGGGTGIMICTKARGSAGMNEFTFLPCTGGSYRWATTGSEPVKNSFYHIVGVWDKATAKAKIYVNGELVNSVSAAGVYTEPSEKSRWFCIGGDASDSDPSNGWKGDIALARIYDNPLTDAQVKALWLDVKAGCTVPNECIVNDVAIYNLPVKVGGYYPIRGTEFKVGDEFLFEGTDISYNLKSQVYESEARVDIPDNFVSGSYQISLKRNNETQRLGRVSLDVVEKMPKAAQVIAHRGFWNTTGSAQNSRKSLELAQALNVYGSETDVWQTTDGKLYINHDGTLNSVNIEKSTSAEVSKLKLSNGESIPTLEEFLTMIKESDSPTKLIIEIKTHSTTANTKSCATAAVAAVKAAGVSDKVEYIAFSLDALDAILAADPDAICAYLSSNKTPKACYELGHKSIDFTYSTYKSNKSYITQAHDLGMTVNAWTFAAMPEMIEATTLDIDLLTTDSPVDGKYIGEYFRNNR